MTPRVAASESGLAQTVRHAGRGCRAGGTACGQSGTRLESAAVAGESPLHGSFAGPAGSLSRAGPEKPCLNPPAPSGKAKYHWETDSARVP